jgi:hypothetical protein
VKIELERKLKALKFHSSEKMIDDVERNNAKKFFEGFSLPLKLEPNVYRENQGKSKDKEGRKTIEGSRYRRIQKGCAKDIRCA